MASPCCNLCFLGYLMQFIGLLDVVYWPFVYLLSREIHADCVCVIRFLVMSDFLHPHAL